MNFILFMLFIGIPALVMAYGVVRTAYRLMTGTMAYELTELDEFGLVVIVVLVPLGLLWWFQQRRLRWPKM
jgi:hypothetical protein